MSLVFYYSALGKTKFVFWLDNAKTHKNKMKTLFTQLMKDFGLNDRIEVGFVHIPAYSPKMNAAEFLIQIIRKRFLKNMIYDQNIEQVLDRLLPNVNEKQLLTPQQMRNILTKIKRIMFQ